MQLLKVLHVEDEPDIREILALSFGTDPGIEAKIVSSGAEAIDILSAGFDPDVIILDVMMPELDGPGTLARIRNLPGQAHTPVIFMSARAQAPERSRYLKLGAIAVIGKPFEPIRLPRDLREIVSGANDDR